MRPDETKKATHLLLFPFGFLEACCLVFHLFCPQVSGVVISSIPKDGGDEYGFSYHSVGYVSRFFFIKKMRLISPSSGI